MKVSYVILYYIILCGVSLSTSEWYQKSVLTVFLEFLRCVNRWVKQTQRNIPIQTCIFSSDLEHEAREMKFLFCSVLFCSVLCCYVMSCHVILFHVLFCSVLFCYVMSCYFMLCYGILCYHHHHRSPPLPLPRCSHLCCERVNTNVT
jgi:hypothetical protein